LILPYFLNLNGPSLWDSTEAFYAETPREMMELDSVVIPQFNYEPRLNKPPLAYWLVIPFYGAFGVSVASERLANALGTGLIIVLTFLLGRRVFGRREGLWAAAVLSTTPRLTQIAQKSIIDTYLTLFVVAALFFFFVWMSQWRRGALILFYLSVGVGVLTKGPIALVLSGGVVLGYVLITRQWPIFWHINIPLGVLILAGIILPWYVTLYLERGWEPIAAFIFRENVGRFLSDIDWTSRGYFYYVPTLLLDFFPWSLVLIPTGIYAYRAGREEHQREMLFLGVWIVFIFVFFSLAQNKHEYYLLPLYPAAAVLIGRFFAQIADETLNRVERHVAQVAMLLGGLALVTGSVILGLFMKQVLAAPMSSEVLPVVLGIGGLWLAARTRGRFLKRAPMAAIGVMYVAVVGYQLIYLPLIEPYRPVKPLCQAIEARARPEDSVGYYKFAAPSMTFYLRRKVFEVYQPDVMLSLLQSDCRVFCILRESDLAELQQAFPDLVILERRPMLTLRLSTLIGSQPPDSLPHVLLISNRSRKRP
jgi:4-amino-4-deoxy-L-arabinose transferase-like glycosyltransferase